MHRCLQVAVLLVALPITTFGQPPAMSGVVRHRLTGQPIECLHVALAASLDRTVAHTVTDSSGMFVLVAPDTGTFRVQFEIPGTEPLTGPLTRLAAGQMNEQEYPLSFDKRISGELELVQRGGRKTEVVDLADWHSTEPSPSDRHPPPHGRMASESEFIHASATAVDQKRFVFQFIVDPTGRPRGTSWRTIASNDDGSLGSIRQQVLGRQYVPARNGEERVCQLVMQQIRIFRTGPAGRPLR